MIFIELFLVFFMIGLFTIGGGYAMIPMIQDLVVMRGWLSKDVIWSFVIIAESTPGPLAVNTATLVGFNLGMERYGVIGALFGAVFTTLGVVLPSFIIIIIIAKHFQNFMNVKPVKDALGGIKAIVVGLILAVVFNLLTNNILSSLTEIKFDVFAVIIIGLIYGATLIYKKLSPIFLILISGALGIIFYYVLPLVF